RGFRERSASDGKSLVQRRAYQRTESRCQQCKPIEQAGVAVAKPGSQFAAPGNRRNHQRQAGSPQRLQEFAHVVEQSSKARRIATRFLVQATATTVEEKHVKPCVAQVLTTCIVPCAVTLNAVQANHTRGRFTNGWIVPIVPAVAVAGGVRPGQRISQAGTPS